MPDTHTADAVPRSHVPLPMACFAAALLLFSFAGPALELRAGVRAVEMASRLLFLAAILICATKPSTRWLATCLATGASAFARSELLPSFVAAALFDAALILCAGAVTVRAIVRALAGNQRLRCSVVCLLMGFFFADVFITSAAALARRVEFAATSEMPQQQLAGFFFSYPGNYWRDCPLREGAQ